MDRAGWQRWWTRRGERELRRILLEEWDPIEVGDVPEAHGEYDNYFDPLVRRLRDGASPADIADYLTRIEEDFMGLSPTPETRRASWGGRCAARLLVCRGNGHGRAVKLAWASVPE